MTSIERAAAQNILLPILEVFFKVEIRFLDQGQLPTAAHGVVLKEHEFKSTWITPNTLIRDFHDTVAQYLWESTDPDRGCVFWVRDTGTCRQGDKNFTHFTYAVDAFGADSGTSSHPLHRYL